MKDKKPPSSWHTIIDPKAAKALSQPATRQILAPFLERERSISEVAKELDINKNALLLNIRNLVELKLITITREEPRKGRAIKYYKAVAEGFFIPYTATTFDAPETWLLNDYASRERLLAKATMQAGLTWGIKNKKSSFGKRFYKRDDGTTEVDFSFSTNEDANLLSPAAPAVISTFVFTNLDFTSAKKLQKEMLDLVKKYEKSGKGQAYLLRLGLAPIVGTTREKL
ncbi:MAG: hypothetical protein ACRCYY_08400 [Trueperaceae bacterium]